MQTYIWLQAYIVRSDEVPLQAYCACSHSRHSAALSSTCFISASAASQSDSGRSAASPRAPRSMPYHQAESTPKVQTRHPEPNDSMTHDVKWLPGRPPEARQLGLQLFGVAERVPQRQQLYRAHSAAHGLARGNRHLRAARRSLQVHHHRPRLQDRLHLLCAQENL